MESNVRRIQHLTLFGALMVAACGSNSGAASAGGDGGNTGNASAGGDAGNASADGGTTVSSTDSGDVGTGSPDGSTPISCPPVPPAQEGGTADSPSPIGQNYTIDETHWLYIGWPGDHPKSWTFMGGEVNPGQQANIRYYLEIGGQIFFPNQTDPARKRGITDITVDEMETTVAEFYQRAFGQDLPESATRVKVA